MNTSESTHQGLRVPILLKAWKIIHACSAKRDISGVTEGLFLSSCVVCGGLIAQRKSATTTTAKNR